MYVIMPLEMMHWKRRSVNLPIKSSNVRIGPLNIPETIAELLENPKSPVSLLKGHATTLLDAIYSYTDVAVSPCDCCRDKPVAYCCQNYKLMACMLPVEPHRIYPEELSSIITEIESHGETILHCAVGVGNSISSGYCRLGPDGLSMGCSCASPQPETYMVVTTSGFYSDHLNFRWKESVNRPYEFTGFLVGSASDNIDGCWGSSIDPTSPLQFLSKTWDDEGQHSRSGALFNTGNPQLNKAFRTAIEEQLQTTNM